MKKEGLHFGVAAAVANTKQAAPEPMAVAATRPVGDYPRAAAELLTTQLNIRVPRAHRARLRQIALSADAPLADLCRMLISDFLNDPAQQQEVVTRLIRGDRT